VLLAGDPEFAAVRHRLHDYLAEPVTAVHARLRTAIECLSKAGWPVGCELAVEGCYDNGWALLRAGEAMIACTTVRVNGISAPVAVSIMSGTGVRAAGAA
jgi:enediyne polyketide synthase